MKHVILKICNILIKGIRSKRLKEYDQKDYLSFQKKGAGETNILQQIL